MAGSLGYGHRRLIEKIIKVHWDIKKFPIQKKFNYNEILFIIQEMQQEEGKMYLQKNVHHLRGHRIFREFVKLLLYRNLANYDSMVLITADKGTGKSSAAIMMAREWCRLIGIRFNPERHMAYSNADVMNKIDMLNKFEPLICLPGNTYIQVRIDGKEKKIQIKKLVELKNYEVLSYNIEQDKFEWETPEKTQVTGKEVIDTIELENGIKLQATSNHLILTKKRGYIKVKDLIEDDELILNSKKCKICDEEFFNPLQYALTCSENCSKKSRIPYRISNPKKSKEWYRKRHQYRKRNDILYRLRHNLHTRMMSYVKGLETNKEEDRTEKIIGCNIQQLKEHLEKQFDKNMCWENYGGSSRDKWSIDHIIPLSKFDLTIYKERQKCFHYSNIQPLWNNLNSAKGRWNK